METGGAWGKKIKGRLAGLTEFRAGLCLTFGGLSSQTVTKQVSNNNQTISEKMLSNHLEIKRTS